jgi:oxygen-independent coproporphyrinogen-3 oxidase
LQALGRVHDADEARRAAEAALMIFGNVNFDLMYALPRRPWRRMRRSCRGAQFAPPHLSFYHLTLEPNTLFHRHPPPLPDEDTARTSRMPCTRRSTAPAIVTTRRRPTRSRAARAAQLNYWQFGDYLGIGAGAHSKLSYSRPHRAPGALEAAQAVSRAHREGCPLLEEVTVARDDIGSSSC